MSFDFHRYIHSVLPLLLDNQQLQTKTLSGGFTNLTIRATFQPVVRFQSRTIHTAVLKYAPPFALTDPDQPMSIHRQLVEAGALEILAGSTSFPALSALRAQFPAMHIPELIYHDTKHHVLWISDLGDTRMLSEYLESDPAPASGEIEHFASQLGAFIAGFHRATANPPPLPLFSLEDPLQPSDICEMLTNITKSVLISANLQDADTLAARACLELQDKGDEVCLGMVDFWPANILIDREGHYGLIDWEYFGLANAASEIGMFRGYSLCFSSSLYPQHI
jgi:hypothetical protein